eukprot:jgi/Tetstr1/422518/TSEL_001279.t1
MSSARPAQRQIRFSSFRHPASSLHAYLDSRLFVSQCQLLVAPSPLQPADDGATWLPSGMDDWSFCRARGSLSELAGLAAAQPGHALHILSDNGARLLASDCDEVAVAPGGAALNLCVTSESYTRLGLPGVKRGERYGISVSFKQLARERVKTLLQAVRSDVALLVTHADGRAPTAAELAPLREVEADALRHATCCLRLDEVALMQGLPGHARDCLSAEDCAGLHEWLGAVSCAVASEAARGADGSCCGDWEALDPPLAGPSELVCHQWEGLMVPQQLHALVAAGRSLLQQGRAAWVCLGSWQHASHYRGTEQGGGKDTRKARRPPTVDEGSFVVLLPEEQYLLITCCSEES